MVWSTLWFGKHKGKTLPQIVFIDPDWFFWAIGEGVFSDKEKLTDEANGIYAKATSIKIPHNESNQFIVEYSIHFPTKKFLSMEILDSHQKVHVGTTRTQRSEVIDLSIPRQISSYDKLGCKHMIKDVKQALFRSSSYRMTKERCEVFFNDENNFDL